ncbi:class I SAM-dependent methyltransferase [Rhizobium binxianense]
MVATDKLFAGAIPDIYDRLLVPLIFEGYAGDLAERVAGFDPHDLLEIAAGTGAVTRAMASRLGPEVRITASDLNQPMLDLAMARQKDDGRIAWRQADATTLPFGPEAFDTVVCQFGVMFFPDRIQAYREVHRVLKPGGRYLFDVWTEISESDFPTAVQGALAEIFPENPPRFMERVPHGYHDRQLIRDQLEAAGFAAITTETLQRKSRAGSAREVATAYCQGTPLRSEIEARSSPGLDAVTETVAEALARRFGTGPIEGRIGAHVVSAAR